MKTKFFKYSGICFLFFLFVSASCTSQKNTIDESIFLNQKEAETAILTDDSEKYFAKIQAIDVAIQMKNNELLKSKDYLSEYREFLKREISEFSREEKKMLMKAVQQALSSIALIHKKGVSHFKLAKIKTNHYGPNVYYTRGNTIFIPENIFETFNHENVMTILLHEFWHILAEQYPELKERLYGIIGFKKNDFKIKYPEILKNKLLTNPDGAHDDYTLVTAQGKRIIPLITSGKNKFDPTASDFFSYLKFDLYEVDSVGNVMVNQNGETALNTEDQQNYFKYIGDNTQYIIHPDEVIADNFMLAVKANKTNDFNSFSPSGKIIIKKIMEALKK